MLDYITKMEIHKMNKEIRELKCEIAILKQVINDGNREISELKEVIWELRQEQYEG